MIAADAAFLAEMRLMDYSLLLGTGTAVAFCAAVPLLDALRSPTNVGASARGPLLVLVRNVSSRQFRPALLTIAVS